MNITKLAIGGVVLIALTAGLVALSKPGDKNAPAATAQASSTPTAITHLTPPAAQTLIAAKQSDPGFVILDVRTAAEFAAGHIATARNIDFYAPDISAQIAALDHAATYLTYCHTGNRSGKVAQMMQSLGFAHIYDLSGGIQAWQAASLPVQQ